MKIDYRKAPGLALLLSLLLVALAPFSTPRSLAAVRPHSSTPTSVTLAGSLEDQITGCGVWDPACAAAHLTDMGNGVWRGEWSITAGSYAYKMALNDSWTESYAGNHQDGGGNTTLVVPTTQNVRFYFDTKTNAVEDSIMDQVAVAAGTFQSELGCSADWLADCVRSLLTDQDGDGTYAFESAAIPVGTYQFKVALNEAWDVSYPANNVAFSVTTAGQNVRITWNKTTNAVTVTAGHGHDNNVEYAGLSHDTRNSLYRVPFGAVNPGTAVMLRLRTFHNDVTGVVIRLYDTAVGQENKQPMVLAATNVDCFDAALTASGSTCDYYQYVYTPQALSTVYYRFIISDGSATAYYADTDNRYDGLGVATSTEIDNGFRLNVVDPNFKIIPWMQNGVMYQIFPDRFRNGTTSNDPNPTDFRYDYPAPPNPSPQQIQAAADAQIQNRPWTALPEGYCVAYVNPATPCTETPKGRDYFGGDLKGVDDKLDYLKSVGISVVYFNPIFESGSNHGYDTRDYLTISRYFGSNADFTKLVSDASARNMRIVLDGVFNHLSSDSPFFDRYHHYTSVGACESFDSPYRSWFVFHDVAPGAGPCVGSDANHSATYDGWAGFDSIPVIVKRSPTDPNQPYQPVAQYFYADPQNSVAGYWLHQGSSGWRFDVMTDPSFPPSYWQQLRTITKGIKPDEILIAEAWHWYDVLPLTHGDQADTAMGYRFRDAVLGLLGAVDNKGFPQENDPNLPPSTFATRMSSIREDYADATYYTSQNLLDSHDTKRILWSLTPGQDNREDKEFNAANLAVGKAREAVAATVQMTVPGTPSIYYGDEVALTGADDPDDRRTFPWNQNPTAGDKPASNRFYFGAGGDHALLDLYRQLTTIRRDHHVLRQGKLTFLLTDDTNKTLAYALRDGNTLATVVINRNESVAQTINVPTAGYLRDGVTLKDVLTPSNPAVTTAGGKFSVTLPPLGAAILVMPVGQDITGPLVTPLLTATASNGVTSSVILKWNASPQATSYNVYRSPVQGGGYVKIATTPSVAYNDATVHNGTTYYYVVRGVDALGNEGNQSREASATPAFPIGYAVLQYPKTVNQVISATPVTVYGQFYIQGLTDAGGDPSAIQAQVGFGPFGTAYTTWNWQPMTFNAAHGGDNNYEYMGNIRADTPGTYNYLVRFSDDGGRTWVYGDQNGVGTAQPGVMTITASSDHTAPTTPVAAIDWSATSLTVSWTASTDPDDAVAEYHVYRGTTPGGESTTPIAIVPGTVTNYVDTTVGNGQTYYYVVKAYDTALNASPASNEVGHMVTAKLIHTTFKVKVPTWTPAGDTIYISGSPDPLCNYCGGGTPATTMTETAPGSHIWQITIDIADGTPIQYKYTRGNYNYVEEWGSITGLTNRVATVHANSPSDQTQLFDDTSDTNPDDNHKAVQNWRDAIVTGTTPSNGATGAAPATINVTFNWDVKPEGTDFSNAITVTKTGSAVTGTISHDSSSQSLTWTPASSLTSGTYSVTVDHVVSVTPTNDGIKIRTPYTFSFTVN
ncbi:MAG: Ig-like domain-containing protein [Herpetosiphonaceae bacterium]|nr:Ig-like domain-containing protein [Herpetosiphonaceae bacterium]